MACESPTQGCATDLPHEHPSQGLVLDKCSQVALQTGLMAVISFDILRNCCESCLVLDLFLQKLATNLGHLSPPSKFLQSHTFQTLYTYIFAVS